MKKLLAIALLLVADPTHASFWGGLIGGAAGSAIVGSGNHSAVQYTRDNAIPTLCYEALNVEEYMLCRASSWHREYLTGDNKPCFVSNSGGTRSLAPTHGADVPSLKGMCDFKAHAEFEWSAIQRIKQSLNNTSQ